MFTRSPLVQLDWRVVMWRPYRQWPQLHGVLDVLVVGGQRGPTTTVALSWLGWHSWRNRNPRPLLVFLMALALLNVSVGVVKLGTGRVGPHHAHAIGSTELFRGGDIFPSGHTANSVVIWGTLAYLAPRHRKAAAVLSAVAALVVGLTTVYLGTHWFSDVLGGWAAGALVLMTLPYCEPFLDRAAVWSRGLAATLRGEGVPTDRGRARGDGPGGTPTGPTPADAPDSWSGVPAPGRVSSAGAAVAFHLRVWNERGPPSVSKVSFVFCNVPWVSDASGTYVRGVPLRRPPGRVFQSDVARAGSRCWTTEIISGSSCTDRGGPCDGPTRPA
ncbi:phosphatase PAP2 family protein [Streptomyces spinosirectus]